jgi:hypothetical protein
MPGEVSTICSDRIGSDRETPGATARLGVFAAGQGGRSVAGVTGQWIDTDTKVPWPTSPVLKAVRL